MSSFTRAVASVFAAGMLGGAGVLMLLPAEADVRVAAMRVPDPPALACKRQTWANSDRGCMTWTSPQGELALAAERAAVRQAVVVAVPDDLVPAVPPRRYAAAPADVGAQPGPQAPAVKYLAETAAAVDAPVAAPLAVAVVAPVASSTVPAAPDRSVSSPVRSRAESPRPVRQATAKAIVTNVSGRPVVIRPTSQQDVYYYAARARLAAATGPVQR